MSTPIEFYITNSIDKTGSSKLGALTINPSRRAIYYGDGSTTYNLSDSFIRKLDLEEDLNLLFQPGRYWWGNATSGTSYNIKCGDQLIKDLLWSNASVLEVKPFYESNGSLYGVIQTVTGYGTPGLFAYRTLYGADNATNWTKIYNNKSTIDSPNDIILTQTNQDRFVEFAHINSIGAKSGGIWRTGVLGTGTGDANYFVIQSDKNVAPAEDGVSTFYNALQIGIESLNITAAGEITASKFNGIATKATKLNNTSAIGSATKPVYFTANGVPYACSYKLEADVPADAKFTDTVYSHPTTAGNKHIPSGGSTGQLLKYGGTSGTAVWETIYYAGSSSVAGAATKAIQVTGQIGSLASDNVICRGTSGGGNITLGNTTMTDDNGYTCIHGIGFSPYTTDVMDLGGTTSTSNAGAQNRYFRDAYLRGTVYCTGINWGSTGNAYAEDSSNKTITGINFNNTSVKGINGLYFSDASGSITTSDNKNYTMSLTYHEGIHFIRTSGGLDSIYCLDGKLKFLGNRSHGSITASYSANIPLCHSSVTLGPKTGSNYGRIFASAPLSTAQVCHEDTYGLCLYSTGELYGGYFSTGTTPATSNGKSTNHAVWKKYAFDNQVKIGSNYYTISISNNTLTFTQVT